MGMERLTADLTDSAKGPSGTQYRNQKQRQTAILPTCKQGKALHRFKVQGGVNVFKLFYQFNPDLKVWLAQTQKLQRGHPKGAVVSRGAGLQAALVEMPRKKSPWLLRSLSVLLFHTPGISVNCFTLWCLQFWLL